MMQMRRTCTMCMNSLRMMHTSSVCLLRMDWALDYSEDSRYITRFLGNVRAKNNSDKAPEKTQKALLILQLTKTLPVARFRCTMHMSLACMMQMGWTCTMLMTLACMMLTSPACLQSMGWVL